TPRSEIPSGVISGSVVDADNHPIRRAIVALYAVDIKQEAVAWSNENGLYSFSYLPAGRYQIRASKDGFQLSLYGSDGRRNPAATIQLAERERRSINFRLPVVKVISGIVMDEDGDPISGAQVQVFLPGFRRGKRAFQRFNGANTDVNGRYQIISLQPGKY